MAAQFLLLVVGHGGVCQLGFDSFPTQPGLQFLFSVVWIGIPMLALVRFGLLAGGVAFALSVLGVAGPFGEGLNDWSNESYRWILTGTIIIAAFAFYTSLAGRSISDSARVG